MHCYREREPARPPARPPRETVRRRLRKPKTELPRDPAIPPWAFMRGEREHKLEKANAPLCSAQHHVPPTRRGSDPRIHRWVSG